MDVFLKPLKEVYNATDEALSCVKSQYLNECFSAGTTPMSPAIVILLLIISYSFIWSIIGNNCSKVDQIWSITPVVFCWTFYTTFPSEHPRLLLICLLVTCWGVRLTYNFWRRGGYGNFFVHEEDYRWPILREKMNSVSFFIFNLTFIATYQNVLLFLLTLPVYHVMMSPERKLDIQDIILAAVFVFLLLVETAADQQQWEFHSLKCQRNTEASNGTQDSLKKKLDQTTCGISNRDLHNDLQDGFLQSGLFRYCRHPAYFAEQSMWMVVYLFSQRDIATINSSVLGVVLLMMLFQGSAAFGESISASKYPAYKYYQQRTAQFFPLPPFLLRDLSTEEHAAVESVPLSSTALDSAGRTGSSSSLERAILTAPTPGSVRKRNRRAVVSGFEPELKVSPIPGVRATTPAKKRVSSTEADAGSPSSARSSRKSNGKSSVRGKSPAALRSARKRTTTANA